MVYIYRKEVSMGALKKIKAILLSRGMTQIDLARHAGKSIQTLRNLLHRDSMSYATVEELLDSIDCEIVFRDKQTGKIFSD